MHVTAMMWRPTEKATEVRRPFLLSAAPCMSASQEEGDYEDEEDAAAEAVEAAERYVECDVFGRKEVRLNVASMDSVSAFFFDMW